MRVYRGTIITCIDENEIVNFLVEDQGIIMYVGDALPGEFLHEEHIELGKHKQYLKNIKIEKLYLQGRLYKKQKQSIVSIVIKGLLRKRDFSSTDIIYFQKSYLS